MKDMQPEYVDELKDYDIDMLEHSLGKNAKDYKAIDLQGALVIMRNLLGSTLKKVGVQISKDSTSEDVDAKMKRNNVKVEHRMDYRFDDTWRNGLYVYKGMDLAGFISEPLRKQPSVFEIDRTPHIIVRAALQ